MIAASCGVLLGSLLWLIGLRTWLILGVHNARPGPSVSRISTYSSQRFKRFLIGEKTAAQDIRGTDC